MATRAAALYDEDYYAWAKGQADALRDLAKSRWNGPLDLENLAEEVDDLARSEWRAVRSQTCRLIEHLLKLEYAGDRRPRRRWIISTDDARRELQEHLTPTLRRELELALADVYRGERKRTARKLALSDDRAAAAALPVQCPYTLEHLLDEDWFPTSRHGYVDEM